MATPSYTPSAAVSNLWGLAQGRTPYAGGLAMSPAPVPDAMTEMQRRRLMSRVFAQETGYNGAPQDIPSGFSTGSAALDRAAWEEGNRARQLSAGNSAVAALKRQQWINGTRTLADEEAGAQLPLAYQQGYRPPVAAVGPNGVRGGVAFRDGLPVGFAGAVPGLSAGIPEAGMRASEQEAFNKALWSRVQGGVNSGAFAGRAAVPMNPTALEIQGPPAPPGGNLWGVRYAGEISDLGQEEIRRRIFNQVNTPVADAASNRTLSGAIAPASIVNSLNEIADYKNSVATPEHQGIQAEKARLYRVRKHLEPLVDKKKRPVSISDESGYSDVVEEDIPPEELIRLNAIYEAAEKRIKELELSLPRKAKDTNKRQPQLASAK